MTTKLLTSAALAGLLSLAAFAPAEAQSRQASRPVADEGLTVDADGDGATAAGLLLPAVQSAREAARPLPTGPGNDGTDTDSDGASAAAADANHDKWIDLDSVSGSGANTRTPDRATDQAPTAPDPARVRRGMQELKH